MRYYLFILLLLISLLKANNLEIVANSFYHKESERKAIFSGNVIAKEGGNLIKANKLIVYLDENNEATAYEAVGNVYFEIKDELKKRNIKGRCKRLRYVPKKDTYYLRGRVEIEDILNQRKVYGDEIIIDNKNNISIAKSLSKKPVKFIFKVKEKNKKGETKKNGKSKQDRKSKK